VRFVAVTLSVAILFAASLSADLRTVLHVPLGFPLPPIPKDNPPTSAKIELGRRLFYERRLSGNGTQSCGDCHQQSRAFTDGRARAIGSTGQTHFRASMPLANSAYAATLTWADPSVHTLEQQVLVPLRNEAPVEMGVKGREREVLSRLRAANEYRALFAKAFPSERKRVTLANVAKAIASFERSILSGRSRYDRLVFGGDSDALDASEKRGMQLFFSTRLGCGHCHTGILFAGPSFENTALYDVDGGGGSPDIDTGLHRATGNCADMGKFRIPSLRNVAVTAPYMHDGSLATLDAVLDHYSRGGRAGGDRHPLRSVEMHPFTIMPEETRDVIAFLHALTDDALLTDARLSNPATTSPQRAAAAHAPLSRPSIRRSASGQ
jgi:cytochrome c peroxidase